MAKKTMTESAPKAAAKPKKTAATTAVPSTDALPDGGAEIAKTTKARATSVPPKAKAAAAAVTQQDVPTSGLAAISDDQIREHAYHLWLSGHPGSPEHHWHTAERTLRSRK